MAKKKSKKQQGKPGRNYLVQNKRARYEFEILERLEVGLVLVGTEVKSLRARNASLQESYVRITGKEAFWIKGSILEYEFGNVMNHRPDRPRKLLLRKAQIRKLGEKVQQKSLTLVPLSIYIGDRGLMKMEIALCRGKKTYDKRAAEPKKSASGHRAST